MLCATNMMKMCDRLAGVLDITVLGEFNMSGSEFSRARKLFKVDTQIITFGMETGLLSTDI